MSSLDLTTTREGRRLPNRRCRYATDNRAVTTIEYAMIGALIAAVIAGTVFSLGTHLNELYATANL